MFPIYSLTGMFKPKPEPEKFYSLKDLQNAIMVFAHKNNVTEDIFYELLFSAATDYYIKEYAPQHTNLYLGQSNDYLFGPGKIQSSRPFFANIDYAYSKAVGLFLHFQEQPGNKKNPAGDDLVRANRLWEEVIKVYFEYKLGYKFKLPDGKAVTVPSDPYDTAIELPVNAIIEKFLPLAVEMIPTVLKDNVKARAYALPGPKLTFTQMMQSINCRIAKYQIDCTDSDVFEFSICTILGVELPTKALFYPKPATTYLDTKFAFHMDLKLFASDAENLVTNANAIQENAIQLVSEAKELRTFEIQFDFIADHILPRMSALLINDLDFRVKCIKQYAERCKDAPKATFYSEYHTAEQKPLVQEPLVQEQLVQKPSVQTLTM